MTKSTLCSSQKAKLENNIDLYDEVYRTTHSSCSVLMIGQPGASTALLRASLARSHCSADLVTTLGTMLLVLKTPVLPYDGIVINLDGLGSMYANNIIRIIRAHENYRTIPIFGVTNITVKRGCGAGVQRIEMKSPP